MSAPSPPPPPALCPSCGQPLPSSLGFCPACLLRGALAGGEADDLGDSPVEDAPLTPAGGSPGTRFGPYQLLHGPDGQPRELGRGAMGVTYQAVDLALCRPVALKVIGERCLGDPAARQRFVREARAAAQVRHPNVASVFHLGQRGGQYFYAMEWVAGETLGGLPEARGLAGGQRRAGHRRAGGCRLGSPSPAGVGAPRR